MKACFRLQNVGCKVQGAKCRVQGARCRVQATGCKVHGVKVLVHSRCCVPGNDTAKLAGPPLPVSP